MDESDLLRVPAPAPVPESSAVVAGASLVPLTEEALSRENLFLSLDKALIILQILKVLSFHFQSKKKKRK